MDYRKSVRPLAVAALLTGLAACGGGGGGTSYPIAVSFSTAPPSSMTVGTTASMAADVENDGANAGVNWSVSCSASDCGSFNPAQTASDATTIYTAPAATPTPATVTITATSVTDSTKTASASVTIAAASVPVLADGTYIFHLSGTDGSGPYSVAGAFKVANGAITGGEQDFSDPNAGYSDSLVPATSSIGAAGGNIQVVLDTGNQAIGVNGVETLRGTVVSATRVLITEFDLSATGSGSADLQSVNPLASSGYAFAVSGNDPNGYPLSIGGVLDFSGTALVPAGSVFDFSVFGTSGPSVASAVTFDSGSLTAPDAYGRVTMLLTPAAASGIPAFAFAGYIVGPGRIELVESAETGDVLNANTGGSALGQGIATGMFSATSVAGQTYTLGNGGVDLNNPVVFAGPITLNAGGTLSGTLAANDLTVFGAWNVSGTYTVDATGRVTANLALATSTNAPPASTLTFEFYLDGSGAAMVVGADTFQTTQGIAYPGGTANLAGNFALTGQGLIASGTGYSWSAAGPVTITSGTFTGFTDYNSSVTPNPQPDVALGGTVDSGNGVLKLTGLNGTDFTATSSFGYYGVSGNRTWGIEVDSAGVSLIFLEPVTTPN
jgi:hypothetical protein